MPHLTIDQSSLNEGWEALSVRGEIDIATVKELEAAISRVFDGSGSKNLAIDLRETSFMDSSGLKSIVMSDRRFREAHRRFAVAVNAGPISRLIDLSGVDEALTIIEDLKDLTPA